EWVHVQLHQQKGMISLSPPTICNSALASTLMAAPERNLYMVKTMLGHRNVSTTLEYVEMDLKGTARILEAELSKLTDDL
ncbi:hypothetical protein AB7Y05_12075, partial [Escherichia coli]